MLLIVSQHTGNDTKYSLFMQDNLQQIIASNLQNKLIFLYLKENITPRMIIIYSVINSIKQK